MNYDTQILAILESLKADKSIPAEYKNAVLSTGKRWMMEIRGVLTMTNLREPEGMMPVEEARAAYSMESTLCTCPPGGVRKDCPIAEHRAKAERV